MQTIETAKTLCKEHGIKGFRKMALKRPIYVAGKQGAYIERTAAKNLVISLSSSGYVIPDKDTCLELADKGLLDCITIYN